MKLFDFAIASVVDANTGYGLAHRYGYRDYAGAERLGRSIRSRSVLALLDGVRKGLGKVLAGIRRRALLSRETAKLMQMNDHLLRDIGLTRGDVLAVRLGQVTLEQLDATRRAARRYEVNVSARQSLTTLQSGSETAVNAACFDEAKCA